MSDLEPETIQVIGLGYVGLPTAAMFSTQGFTVYGYDTDPERVRSIAKKRVPFEEPELEALIRAGIDNGNLRPDTEPRPADVHLICVPTPLNTENGGVDLSHLESAAEALAPHLREDDIVVVESTVPVGTTEDVIKPILGSSGLDVGSELHLAMCPETVLPGNIIHELAHNDRIVGGITEEAARHVRDLYLSFVKGEIFLTDARTAEFAKLAQNTYRDVNIALANDFARLAETLDVDIREGIEVANRHPRVSILRPGPGVGGHCIPIDPWFLLDAADEDQGAILRTAREVNRLMPRFVVDLVLDSLGAKDIDPSNAKIALLGLAYKGNVDDIRESPSLEIADILMSSAQTELCVNDPHVQRQASAEAPSLVELDDAIDGAHCILIATDHDEYKSLDPVTVGRKVETRILVDTRGIVDANRWRQAGFTVRQV